MIPTVGWRQAARIDSHRDRLSRLHASGNRQYRAPRSRAMRSLSHRSGLPMLSPSRTVCASCERWEPSWEPFAVDRCGRLWTSADCDPFDSGRYGRLRTAMDGLRPSTDQEVEDSSSSGRARDALVVQGHRRVTADGPYDVWEPFWGAILPSRHEHLIAHRAFFWWPTLMLVKPIGRPEVGRKLVMSLEYSA